ncbi:hypothetical protein CORC01_02826 [Colletotrichum orchidophilum]|uniref:Uncharacterized protein n=1 Tax=Colletotrichum orchidophilum TaxID=1209926 RepID=A0A1G4BKW9_9PEZI|nr:uncharacterized protein CORC01_02826 [Colletotrichum orchidophilum]OHF01948.1 hypothetical protein CORC01_02826 [Colletotrichum orchidophilum]
MTSSSPEACSYQYSPFPSLVCTLHHTRRKPVISARHSSKGHRQFPREETRLALAEAFPMGDATRCDATWRAD